MRGLSDLNSGGGGGAASQGGGGGGCADCIKGIWANTPLWTRTLFIVCLAVYGLSWVSSYVLYALFCSPPLVIYKFQVWRLFTGLFVHPQLLTLLFALMSHLPHAKNAENSIGTVRYFFRFWMCGFIALLMFTIVCGIAQLQSMAIGLWPMLFCDLVIECMATPDQEQGLCCLPIKIKRKWYPLILIAIFSLFFFQLDMWFGLAVGYMYHYGLFKRIEMGTGKATTLEDKWPFKRFKEKPYFITAGAAMGGTISVGSVLNGGGTSSARENPDTEAAAASTQSANANFKSFTGKGISLGGEPVAPPRYDSRGASASRGRSTPATRAASAQGSERQGSALIAKLEEKKREEAITSIDSSALTTTDVGHDMEPQDTAVVKKSGEDDKDDGNYAAVNETEDSV